VNNDIARFNMIEQQIRPWEVLDGQVLALLLEVKRENFAPMAHKALAFVDMEIPLGKDADSDQVMLAPRVEARFLQNAAVKHTDKVLEIGTGSGYMAALLAHQAASVLSFELDPALAQQARANLQTAGIHNAEVPQVLLNQLSIGGRLLAVVGEDPMMRASVITRTAEQQWQTSEPWDTIAPRLKGFPEHNRFAF